jgi:hypothetical protein
MPLLTEEQKQQLLDNGQPENRDKDHSPVVRLFIPFTACTWLLSELDHQEPDIAFGLCDLGMGFPELGYVSIDELSSIKLAGTFEVMCDNAFSVTYPMSVYARAARMEQMITTNPDILRKAANILEQELKQGNSLQPS